MTTKCLQTLPNVSRRTKSSLVENYWTRQSPIPFHFLICPFILSLIQFVPSVRVTDVLQAPILRCTGSVLKHPLLTHWCLMIGLGVWRQQNATNSKGFSVFFFHDLEWFEISFVIWWLALNIPIKLAGQSAAQFMQIVTFNPHNNPTRQELLLLPC